MKKRHISEVDGNGTGEFQELSEMLNLPELRSLPMPYERTSQLQGDI